MTSQDARVRDPYIDRRSGEDRRVVYDSDYFENSGRERRHGGFSTDTRLAAPENRRPGPFPVGWMHGEPQGTRGR